MELHLIGEFSILGLLSTAYTILKVAIGLGLVIFVHELGHFVVAKLCGVKCEKFYLGFDIGGWKLAKFQWGETEYGIGILPLGGYVKMLGQDDNPARYAEERERAKSKEAHAAAVKHPGDLPHEPTAEEREEPIVFDPRSYMAKSVPQRMAIISAGVIMNLIFAVIFAAVAYRFGVRYTPTVIGGTSPSDPAWLVGIQPGDKIVQLGNGPEDEQLRFEHDLRVNIALTGPDDSIQIGVERAGTNHVDAVVLQPKPLDKKNKKAAVIGVYRPRSLTLSPEPVVAGSPAAMSDPKFRKGDKIAFVRRRETDNRVNNAYVKQRIGDYFRLQEIQASFADRPLEYYVERPDPDDPSRSTEVQIVVQPNPMRTLGLVMTMGPITAIQKGSPADAAGLQVGDRIASIDGKSDLDPLRIGELLRNTDRGTAVEVIRAGKRMILKVHPRVPRNFVLVNEDAPAQCDELGIAYAVLNKVQSVEKGGPADGKLQPEDEITSATILPDDESDKLKLAKAKLDAPIEFGPAAHSWPFFDSLLQTNPDFSDILAVKRKVRLTWTRGGQSQSATIEPTAAKNWFNPERGLRTEYLSEVRQVDSWGEAFRLGLRETKESVWQVTTTLRKLVRGEFSVTDLAGGIGIAQVAYMTASEGIPQLLIFLTLLSANLAVLNFLPIPVLDGGHMMFLIYEGIRGKPASERTMMALTYAGLIFILALMVFVLGMDIFRLFS